MDFEKVERFVRAHWPAALMVATISAPVVWVIAHTHYSERIAVLDLRIKDLEERSGKSEKQVASLMADLEQIRKEKAAQDELVQRQVQAVKASALEFRELFSPSPSIQKSK
jgi:hypothetical protein